MAKFYGTGAVWDKEKQKVLCEFEGGHYDVAGQFQKGVLETSDPDIIAKLVEAGYKPEDVSQAVEAPKAEPEVKEEKPKAVKKPKAE